MSVLPAERTARVLDGVAIARDIRREIGPDIDAVRRERGFVPELRVVLVGDDAASRVPG